MSLPFSFFPFSHHILHFRFISFSLNFSGKTTRLLFRKYILNPRPNYSGATSRIVLMFHSIKAPNELNIFTLSGLLLATPGVFLKYPFLHISLWWLWALGKFREKHKWQWKSKRVCFVRKIENKITNNHLLMWKWNMENYTNTMIDTFLRIIAEVTHVRPYTIGFSFSKVFL